MGNLSGESREQNRKDKVTRFRSVTYARQLGLLVNTLGSHLKFPNVAWSTAREGRIQSARQKGKNDSAGEQFAILPLLQN